MIPSNIEYSVEQKYNEVLHIQDDTSYLNKKLNEGWILITIRSVAGSTRYYFYRLK